MSLHRMLSASALAAFFLSGSLHAQEPAPPAEPAPQAEENGISAPRQAAGLGVLAFLIGWMIWRSGSRKQKPEKHDAESDADSTAPKE